MTAVPIWGMRPSSGSEFMRRYMMDWLGSPGVRFLAVGTPWSPFAGSVLHSFMSLVAVVRRRSMLTTPRSGSSGRWQNAQLASKYERAFCSVVASAGGVPDWLVYGA